MFGDAAKTTVFGADERKCAGFHKQGKGLGARMAVHRISIGAAATLVFTLAACAAVLAEVPKQGAVGGAPVQAAILTQAPNGYCAFDPKAETSTGLKTGFKSGLGEETQLVAMFVHCGALERAKAGHTSWLPDWVAVETNVVTKPGDDERIVGTRGAVELLCKDAQTAHPKIAAETFTAKADMAHKGLSADKPIIYFGVIGEDEGVCYLASLRMENDQTGTPHRLLAVFAFMLAGERWVYLSTNRDTPDASTAADVLQTAKSAAQDFMRLNP